MGMATLINEDSDEQQEFDNVEETAEEQLQATETTTEQDDDLPEKYKGKSLKEIAQMHQEAEKLLGRHSSEVGELRRVVDDYIRANLAEKNAPKQDDADEDIDFFSDPEKAVAKYIESNPHVQQANQYAQQAKQTTALQSLQARHPDMEKIVNDNRFADWIKGSKVRTQLFVQADQNYDTDAADELFSTWKALNQQAQETASADQQARKQEVRKASTGAARGSVEQRGKKKYRRRDIIELIKNDPARYEALSSEIQKAFSEGRVIS